MILQIRSLTGEESFQVKFLRVGSEIYIIGPQDKEVKFHDELARKHKILERIEYLRSQNPDLLDGGMIFVTGKVIRFGSASTSLSLPITEKARKQTIQNLKRQYPSFSIKDLSDG